MRHALLGPLVVIAIAGAAGCPRTPDHGARPADPATAALVLGEGLALDSRILGERRTINVYLPPGYAAGDARYPVLYMPDGGMGEDFPHVVGSVDVSIKNGIIRPVIVVGIENTERRRDLTPPTAVPDEQAAAPHAGGATAFRAFLRDELVPAITARYRTTDEAAIVGESLAGLFVVETFLVEPTLFSGYIAADPSVWWNEERVVREATARLATFPPGPRALYVATADEPTILDGVAALTTALAIVQPVDVTWTYEPMPAEHHGTIFPTAALHGIRLLFAAPSAE